MYQKLTVRSMFQKIKIFKHTLWSSIIYRIYIFIRVTLLIESCKCLLAYCTALIIELNSQEIPTISMFLVIRKKIVVQYDHFTLGPRNLNLYTVFWASNDRYTKYTIHIQCICYINYIYGSFYGFAKSVSQIVYWQPAIIQINVKRETYHCKANTFIA